MVQILVSLHNGIDGEWQDIPFVATRKIINKSGLTINAPINGLCWDSDLPCMSGDIDTNSPLHLLKDGELSSGFSVKN